MVTSLLNNFRTTIGGPALVLPKLRIVFKIGDLNYLKDARMTTASSKSKTTSIFRYFCLMRKQTTPVLL